MVPQLLDHTTGTGMHTSDQDIQLDTSTGYKDDSSAMVPLHDIYKCRILAPEGLLHGKGVVVRAASQVIYFGGSLDRLQNLSQGLLVVSARRDVCVGGRSGCLEEQKPASLHQAVDGAKSRRADFGTDPPRTSDPRTTTRGQPIITSVSASPDAVGNHLKTEKPPRG